MPSEYPILDNRPIDQWKVVELKEELKRRKLPTRGLKDDLIKRLDEAIRNENESTDENVENRIDGAPEAEVSSEDATIGLIVAETTMDAMDQGDDGNKLLDNHIIHPEDARTESIVAETTRDIEDPRDGGNKLSDDHTIHPEDAKTDPIVAETAKAMEDPGDEGNKSSDDHITHSENARSESIVLETTKDIDGPGDEGNKLFADNITHSEDAKTKPIVTETTKSTIDEGDKGSKLLDNVIAHSEDGRAVSFVSETTEDMVHQSDNGSKLLDNDTSPFDIDDGMNLLGKESVLEAQLIGDSDPAGVAKEQVVQVSASVVSEVSLNEENIQKVEIQREPQMENEVLKFQHKDAELNSSDHNQVSEVSPVLGLQVKSDSISSDSLSINEKNELKDIVIADVDKLELDVKPEMVIPGPSSVISNSGLHSMDVEEPYVNKESVVKRADEIAENTESGRKSNNGDAGSPERLNLDRSSGDDSMEEDVSESKQTDLKFSSNEVGDSGGKTEVQMSKQEPLVGVTGDDLPDDNGIVIDDTKNVPASSSVKRKPHDNEEVGKTETAKRQRRWNSEGFKLPEVQSTKVASSTTPKDAFNPSLKQNTSKIDPTAIDETPKEREVPPSSRPSTNSLKIDRFLRPFTLKAVQELLGKTGSVISFWMDTIKTHCYVTYSSVEEAVNTRNAVYNLQWPPNGGKLLVAEFVDPQEVKMRAEPPPPQTPAAPPLPAAPRTLPPQPSPRQQPQRHLLPSSPPLPPPPLVSNPLQVRERISLPPPPPLPEKLDPPIVTLDDIFRKTRATPRIYYLPLSEEQVAAKLKTSKL